MLKIVSIALLLISVATLTCGQSTHFTTYNDLAYVEDDVNKGDSLQRLNLVVPNEVKGAPLLIWIGGGAWSYGDRNQEMALAGKLAESGIAVASVGHRLSPATWRDPALSTGVEHPQHVLDVASAVKWLYHHAEAYGYDTASFFIGGYSSGAHLATLISLDNRYLESAGLPFPLFKGIIPISGTYDIEHYHQVLANGNQPELAKLHVEAVFGSDTSGFIAASPTSYLHNLGVPMLVICDNSLYVYTQHFEDKIRETDFRQMQVVYTYHLSHGGLWKHLSFDEKSIYRALMVDFININR